MRRLRGLKHCRFLVLEVLSLRMNSHVFMMILCMLLVIVWARSRPARSWHSRVNNLIRVQNRLRLTMQHVYGHSGNLGNEGADHAAALGTYGIISSHIVATRWIRHNFETGSSHRDHCPLCTSRALSSCDFSCSQFSVFFGLLLSQQAMDRLSSSASAAPSINDYSEHNMWNPPLELLFLEQVNALVDSFLVEIDLAKITFSCHFALDLLCYKEEVLISTR